MLKRIISKIFSEFQIDQHYMRLQIKSLESLFHNMENRRLWDQISTVFDIVQKIQEYLQWWMKVSIFFLIISRFKVFDERRMNKSTCRLFLPPLFHNFWLSPLRIFQRTSLFTQNVLLDTQNAVFTTPVENFQLEIGENKKFSKVLQKRFSRKEFPLGTVELFLGTPAKQPKLLHSKPEKNLRF